MKKINYDATLEELLSEVDQLFGRTKKVKPYLASYDYALGRFPYGWVFSVVNSWYKWGNKKLVTDFGCYQSPRLAVIDFLAYVRANKVNVKELMDE